MLRCRSFVTPPINASRRELAAALACFILPLALYASTAARTMQGGDTTEFASLGIFGGVAHPPGYPLYTMLLRLLAHVPIQPLFFRMALASVLCGAGAIVVLQRLALRISDSLWASVTCALGFALTSEQWRLSGVPEVFTMNVLLSLSGILCCFRLANAEKSGVTREALLVGFVFGLGGSNHHTIILCVPVVLWALGTVLQRWGTAVALRALILMSLAALVGLLPYAWLLSTATHTSRDGFVWGDPSTLQGLAFHFFRKEYGTFSFIPGTHEKHPGQQIGRYLATLPAEFGYLLFLAVLAGIVIAALRRQWFALSILSASVLAGPLLLSAMAFDETPVGHSTGQRFYLMPTALLAPFAAIGLASLERRLTTVLRFSLTAVALALTFVVSFPAANWRADTIDERYLTAAVKDLPPKTIVTGGGDFLMFGVHWVSRVNLRRSDILYVDTNFLGLRWFYDYVKRQIPFYPVPFIPDRPAPPGKFARIMMTAAPLYSLAGLEQHMKDDVQLRPAGFATQAVPLDTPKRPASEQLEFLTRQTGSLGEQTHAPMDGYSWEVHSEVARRWDDLAHQLEAEGHADEAARCVETANDWRPTEMAHRRSLLP